MTSVIIFFDPTYQLAVGMAWVGLFLAVILNTQPYCERAFSFVAN